MNAFRVGQYVRVVGCPYSGSTTGRVGVVTAICRPYIRTNISTPYARTRGLLYRPDELEPCSEVVSVPPMSDAEWHMRRERVRARYAAAARRDQTAEAYMRTARFCGQFDNYREYS